VKLEVKDVGKRFGGLRALKDVNLTLEKGELAALIGPNGAGKSTLINIICGSYEPTSGVVEFGGKRISRLRPHEINRLGIVRTFQGLELFRNLTVRENVIAGGVARTGLGVTASLLGWRPVAAAEGKLARLADDILEMVGLEHRKDDPAAILPAGQQRLLAIARSLASGADWLLLDEPGAGLNPVEKQELAAAIRRLRQLDKTILFIEHDMGFVGSIAERVIVLDQGIIIADGLPAEIRANQQVLSAYLGVRVVSADRGAQVGSAVSNAPPCLDVRNLTVRYDGLQALVNVDLRLDRGELVAMVGANGAGKSTFLKRVAGMVPGAEGAIRFDGEDITSRSPRRIVIAGVSLAPEGRELFSSLSVLDNLRLGRYAHVGIMEKWAPSGIVRGANGIDADELIEKIFDLFPKLRERRHQRAGTLSGGEGQMLAVGRALMSSPKLLMLDEPSLGLAPQVVAEILERLLELKRGGLTILLVEQNARAALEIADRAYVLETGRIVAHGPARDLLDSKSIAKAYLG
jgi:branched-chain amino acid transport system ATP-binding protein